MSVFKNGVFSQGFDKTTVTSQVFTSGAIGTISSTLARFPAPNSNYVSQGWQSPGGSSPPSVGLGVQLPSAIVGIAVMPVTLPTPGSQNPFFQFFDSVGNATQVGFQFNVGGQIVAVRGDTSSGITVLGTSTATVQQNAYHQFQFNVTISTTTGFVEVLLDGNPTPILSLSGINTQKTANAFWDTARPGGAQNISVNFDDWWMLDKTGPLTTYLGDKRILTPKAIADSATAGLNQFSTSPVQSAGNHYLNINEFPPNDGTTMNFDATPTDQESYRFPPIVQSAGVISFINVFGRCQKDDATARTVALTSRNGGISAAGATQNTPSSWAYLNDVFINDPSTSAPWTIAGYNGGGLQSAAEFGMEIVS